MSRKLIIDGNAVYEIDEECMLRKRVDSGKEDKKYTGNSLKNSVVSDDDKGHRNRGCE